MWCYSRPTGQFFININNLIYFLLFSSPFTLRLIQIWISLTTPLIAMSSPVIWPLFRLVWHYTVSTKKIVQTINFRHWFDYVCWMTQNFIINIVLLFPVLFRVMGPQVHGTVSSCLPVHLLTAGWRSFFSFLYSNEPLGLTYFCAFSNIGRIVLTRSYLKMPIEVESSHLERRKCVY